jgi:hypothetical protein
MELEYDGQNAFKACNNGDFPLIVLLWGMSNAIKPIPPDLLALEDPFGNTLLHTTAASSVDAVEIIHFFLQQIRATRSNQDLQQHIIDKTNHTQETPLM